MNPFLHLLLPIAFNNPVVPPATDFSNQCSSVLSAADELQVQSDWDDTAGSCGIGVTPREAPSLRYRSYFWDENGLMMAFNSFGEGPDDQMTGARDFYFFPRRMLPSYRQKEKGTLEVRSASGDVFRFNSLTGELESQSNGSIRVDPSVVQGNAGGVEIESFHGIFLDFVWRENLAAPSINTTNSQTIG